MSYLIDTNILIRLIQPSDPMHLKAASSIRKLQDDEETLYIIPQILVEFWAVATRPPSSNGLGLTLADTEREVNQLKAIFTLRLDVPTIHPTWESIVKRHQVAGKQVHDARLVAAMLTHAIDNLLTFNIAHFRRFNEIKLIDPRLLTNP